MNTDKLLDGAVEAAHQAGKIIRKYFRSKIQVREKGDLGLVTNADIAAEKAVIKVLQKCEPRFGFLSEETHSTGRQKKSEAGLWIIDPLDGTTNFVRRFPMFCVTIAAQIKNRIEVAVTYHPILDEVYTSIRGQGAYRNGVKMTVSDTSKMKEAVLTTGFAYQARKSLNEEMKTFENLSRDARAIRRPGSAALDLAYTACGVFDGFWERHLSPWDVAAGSLLVQEAGGKVTDFSGKPFSIYEPEILASNSSLHSTLLKRV